MRTLKDAYVILFGSEPAKDVDDWVIIREILINMNIRKLGEEFCEWISWMAVCQIDCPDIEIQKEIQQRGLNLALEAFPEYDRTPRDEPHSSEIAYFAILRDFNSDYFKS